MSEDKTTSPDVQEEHIEAHSMGENLADSSELEPSDTETILASLFSEVVDDSAFGKPDFAESHGNVTPATCSENEDGEITILQPLIEKLERIKYGQTALAKEFSAKIKYDATKQGQIDKLYQENQAYRNEIIEKFKIQLILAVIEQIDNADKQISHYTKQEAAEQNYSKLLRDFCDVTASFQDMLLERFDVSTFRCKPGTPFDPKRQRALKTLDTSETSQNKTVAATLRPGYEKNNGTTSMIVRPEMVEVFRYTPVFQQDFSEDTNSLKGK